MLELTQEEINKTITRAAHIAEQKPVGDAGLQHAHAYEAYVSAAEEIGIPREAMLQALRESQHIPIEPFRPGDMVFAPSVDKYAYPASVTSVSNEGGAVVKFVSGGDQTLLTSELRPLALVPGRVVQFQAEEAMGSGIWCSGKLLEYDSVNKMARVSYAIETYSIPLTKLRIRVVNKQSVNMPLSVRTLIVRTAIVATAAGGGIGFLLGYLLHPR